VTALEVAVDPALPVEPGERGGPGGRPVVFLGKVQRDAQGRAVSLSSRERPAVPYLATPAVLQRYGIQPGAVGADTDLLTARADLQGFEFLNAAKGRELHPKIQTSPDLPTYTSLPTTSSPPRPSGGWGGNRRRPAGWSKRASPSPTSRSPRPATWRPSSASPARPGTGSGRWRSCAPGPLPRGCCWPWASWP
jgi:putative ABC transport system permease protein